MLVSLSYLIDLDHWEIAKGKACEENDKRMLHALRELQRYVEEEVKPHLVNDLVIMRYVGKSLAHLKLKVVEVQT